MHKIGEGLRFDIGRSEGVCVCIGTLSHNWGVGRGVSLKKWRKYLDVICLWSVDVYIQNFVISLIFSNCSLMAEVFLRQANWALESS